jgi:hypothetical protein
VLVLDTDGDGAITWGELRRRAPEVARLALGQLALSTPAGPCAPSSEGLSLTHHDSAAGNGTYAALVLALGCPASGGGGAISAELAVDYRLFFDRDSQHRAFVQVAGSAQRSAVARADNPRLRFTSAAIPAGGADTLGTLGRYLIEGGRHIWQGLDHLLFLLVLLLPAVLRRTPGGWAPVADLRGALGEVVQIVTAFTVAHSLTLGLAALGLVRVSPRIVEPAIAASVVLTAFNNLWPLFGRDRWAVAFALGLLHGFGFSSVLAEVGLPSGHLLAALFGFNLGVELGQLALVAVFVPLAFALRRTAGYRRVGLTGGSAAAAAIALGWLVQRTFDISVLPSFFG